ncbi:MAG TPA: HNH endonuclease signature motif containing protein [Spirochaetota bacterium]|nr:HNH endonuclease signature motif containing protein [Spirochaetota bacterium]
MKKICKIDGCGLKHYGRGYCHKHHAKYVYNAHREHNKKCDVEGCENTCRGQYCKFHLRRKSLGVPLTAPKHETMRGENNPNWSGGKSDYKNHYTMKKNRLLKIKQTGGLCEMCGAPGLHIHHKDYFRDNHSIENLIFLCQKCHDDKHRGRFNKSKFTMIYGMNLRQLSIKMNKSISTVRYMHNIGLLKKLQHNGAQ